LATSTRRRRIARGDERISNLKDELTPNQPVAPIDYTKDLSCPMLGLFGNGWGGGMDGA